MARKKPKIPGLLDVSALALQISGKELNTTMGDSPACLSTIQGYLSTGSIATDMYLGGGLALGRIHEVYGTQGAGKTALAYHVLRDCLAKNGAAFWAALETGSWDVPRAKAFGVPIERVIVSSPEYLEKLFEYIYNLIKKVYPAVLKTNPDTPFVIVVDSLNAVGSKSLVTTGNVYADGMASRQRAIADFMKIIEIPISKTNICLLFLNQVSANIGGGWGAPALKSAGTGNQFFHHLATSLYLEWMTRGDSGQIVKFHLKKLRTERPHTKWKVFSWYYFGFLEHYELFKLAEDYGLLEKRGGYVYDTSEEGIPKESRKRWRNGWEGFYEVKQEDVKYYDNLKARVQICLQRTIRARDLPLMEEIDKEYTGLIQTLRRRYGEPFATGKGALPKHIAVEIGEDNEKTE